MSLSVLSTVVVLAVIAPHAQMGSAERGALRRLEPSIATIMRGRQDLGTAALVDSNGLFLTHLGSVYAQNVKARLADGRIVEMVLKASDDPTQLAVLQASDWIKSARPLTPSADLAEGDELIAVLPSRSLGAPIRAEFVGKKSGLVAPSRRLMPLAEISFEAPTDAIGGAMVITTQGNLVGFLNAALSPKDEADIHVPPSASAIAGDEGPVPSNMAPSSIFAARPKARQRAKLGPGDMTVAFTPAPSALRHALDSLVRGKEVDRPSIGVDVKNSPGGGALIEKIYPGMGADEAGLEQGDVVIEMNGVAIADQVDLARMVMEQQIGATLKVKVRRGRDVLIVPVTVGSRAARARKEPLSATSS